MFKPSYRLSQDTSAHRVNYLCLVLCCNIEPLHTVEPSIKVTLNKGHLSNEDTACSPNQIELCTTLPLYTGQLAGF